MKTSRYYVWGFLGGMTAVLAESKEQALDKLMNSNDDGYMWMSQDEVEDEYIGSFPAGLEFMRSYEFFDLERGKYNDQSS